MFYIKYKINGKEKLIPLKQYCEMVGKKNNSNLHKIEKYLGVDMLSDDSLKEIRKSLLDISAEIVRLSENIVIDIFEEGDSDERL